MTVKSILWVYEPKHSGKCNVKIYINHEGKKAYIRTKVSINPINWDAKKGKVKNTHPLFKRCNALIRKEVLNLEKKLIDGESVVEVKHKKQTGASFLRFIEDFIDKTEIGLTDIQSSTCKRYRATLNRLKRYCKHVGRFDLSYEDIDLVFYDEFKRFLIENKLSGLPGFSGHIKAIKAMMQLALDRGLHKNTTFQHRLFKKLKFDNDKIYLTKEEIEKIERLDLSQRPDLSLERDRFLISYYFLMRFSDSIRVKKENFIACSGNMYLKYEQKKTGFECMVPVKPNAWSILQNWDFHLSGSSNAVANQRIKKVCALAGIKTPIYRMASTNPNGCSSPRTPPAAARPPTWRLMVSI